MTNFSGVTWITGLSGAGKTTLANELFKAQRKIHSNVILLDGDKLREIFFLNTFKTANHDRPSRLSLAFKYSKLCQLLASQNLSVIIATISMFQEIYNWNRKNLPSYVEVYLKVPLEELKKRDTKGIYRNYDLGKISNVAGLDLNIDEPVNPHLKFEFDEKSTLYEKTNKILNLLYLEKQDD